MNHFQRQRDAGESSMTQMCRYLIRILEKEDRKGWFFFTLASLISPIVDIFSFSVIIFIINIVVREDQASLKLIGFTFLMAGVSALKCLFELYKSKISNRLVFNCAQKLSMKIYELLIKEELKEHNEKSAIQALTMVRNDTTGCVNIIVSSIGICVSGITMAGYGVILIYVSKWIGVVSSIILVLLIAAVFRQNRVRMKAYGEKSRAYAIKTGSQITIAFGTFKEMKIDDRASLLMEKYKDASYGYAQIQSEFYYKSSSNSIIMQNSIMAGMFAALAVFLVAGMNLSAVLAPMVIYITALVRMLPMAYSIIGKMNSIEYARKPYETIKESVTAYENIKKEEKMTENIRQKKLTFKKGLFVRNLTFGYLENVKVFEDASIDIPVGCSIAIIGASGAGKTTFLDLILGLLKPQDGHVLYDDYDIVTHMDTEGVCKANLGELVSYIPQTVFLNGETVLHNVAFFVDDDTIDNEKVEECLRCAQIWEDVQRMPDGVNTLIGENGTTLSGGQRQRVALARALYKDFEFLVMDEATAALDMETEKAVIDSIRQVKGNKTLLMVTHHMSLANECDLIYKIEDKKIVQVKGEGNHQF